MKRKSPFEIEESLIVNGPNMNFEDDYLEPLTFEDEVNKPSHYHKGSIDVIGYLEQHFGNKPYTVAEGFAIGNAIKYVSRYKEKGGMKDLKKAEFYVRKLMEYENA
jgi:hypothetical protein